MTDWLPWGGILMTTTLGTLWALVRDGDATANRALARRILLAGGALTLLAYALYLAFAERWLWY